MPLRCVLELGLGWKKTATVNILLTRQVGVETEWEGKGERWHYQPMRVLPKSYKEQRGNLCKLYPATLAHQYM